MEQIISHIIGIIGATMGVIWTSITGSMEIIIPTLVGIFGTVVAGLLTYFIYRLIKNVDDLKDAVVSLKIAVDKQTIKVEDKEKVCNMTHEMVDSRLDTFNERLKKLELLK